MKALCEKIENYPFESEGGSLKNCLDWKELKRRIADLTAQLESIAYGNKSGKAALDAACTVATGWYSKYEQERKAREEAELKAEIAGKMYQRETELAESAERRLAEVEKREIRLLGKNLLLKDRLAEVERRVSILSDWLNPLHKSVAPFAAIVNATSGRIPVEKLSLSNWHDLVRAFNRCSP